MSEDRALPRPVIPVLVGSILAVSAAAVLVKLIPQVHPIAVAFWRCAIVAALLAPFLRRPTDEGDPIAARDLALTAAAGFCLALHFWSWFASLHLTSVMRSTVLVCLNPIWVGLIEWGVFRQAPPGRFWIGVGAAIAGTVVMSLGEVGAGAGGSLAGDGLALLGGLMGAIYLVVGRRVRQRVSAGAYGSLICGAAAIWLAVAAWGVDASLAVEAGGTGAGEVGTSALAAWGILVAMALGPQLTGHVGLNYAVRYVPAAALSALLLLEPVGATILAAALLGEIPDRSGALGGAIILAGVLAAIGPIRRGRTPA